MYYVCSLTSESRLKNGINNLFTYLRNNFVVFLNYEINAVISDLFVFLNPLSISVHFISVLTGKFYADP
jgi:hypothetical protein